jgi:peptidyl-prolyl cis-trans isomerase A (cyclophilin A)
MTHPKLRFAKAPAPAATLAAALLTTLLWALPATAQTVRLATSEGDIVLELDREKAPKTVDNFVRYVQARHYDGLIFHRVIENFMIQGGGYKPDMSEKPTRAPIPLEAGNGLSNARGSIAMARTGDPNSATAQFFINVADNTRLDTAGGGYAVFGRVVEGMEVVDKIRALPVAPRGMHQHLPTKTVVINKATLEKTP